MELERVWRGEGREEGLVGLVRLVDRIVSRWCAAARVRLSRRGAPRPRSPVSRLLQESHQHFINNPRLEITQDLSGVRLSLCSVQSQVK